MEFKKRYHYSKHMTDYEIKRQITGFIRIKKSIFNIVCFSLVMFIFLTESWEYKVYELDNTTKQVVRYMVSIIISFIVTWFLHKTIFSSCISDVKYFFACIFEDIKNYYKGY